MIAGLHEMIRRYWRPTAFHLDAKGLRIEFPGTERRVPADEILRARILTNEEFRREFGWGIRVGAGGLWGGFGWPRSRRTWLERYISRLDRFVPVERRKAMPLLITPSDPEEFAAICPG